MRILFYTPVNFRCRDIESLAKKFNENGNEVFLLSHRKEGPLHKSFASLGAFVSTYNPSGNNSFLSFFYSSFALAQYCKKNRIDLLFSHLEPTNFVAVITQFFIRARVVIYRHHVDLARLQGFDRSITYRLTYFLAKNVISVSEEGKKFMVEEENVSEQKINVIKLGYDFSLYEAPNLNVVESIRTKYRKDLLLIAAGSLTPFKRPELLIELIYQAMAQGLNASLLFLGKGELENQLKDQVKRLGLEQNVFFLGYIENILDYLAAGDALIHPSISESSCVVVKEAGLVSAPVFVCKHVGDFDDYLVNMKNSVVIDRDSFISQLLPHLHEQFNFPERYRSLGAELKKTIRKEFSISNTIGQYAKFFR